MEMHLRSCKLNAEETTQEFKPQLTHTHTHNYCATAALARPGTTKHQSMRSILDQWVQGTDREARQSKADIKGTISNNAGRIHKNKPSKSRDTHTHRPKDGFNNTFNVG